MSPAGTGDLEEMFLHVPSGKPTKGLDSKAACTRPQKVAQEFIHCVPLVNIVKSEKGRPQLATQAEGDRISKGKSETRSQA
jgi:hypothetical protein